MLRYSAVEGHVTMRKEQRTIALQAELLLFTFSDLHALSIITFFFNLVLIWVYKGHFQPKLFSDSMPGVISLAETGKSPWRWFFSVRFWKSAVCICVGKLQTQCVHVLKSLRCMRFATSVKISEVWLHWKLGPSHAHSDPLSEVDELDERGTWLESVKEIRGMSWQRRCQFFLKRNGEKVYTIKMKVGGEE